MLIGAIYSNYLVVMKMITLGTVLSRSFTFRSTAMFSSKFDCDSCSKKLTVPECKACDRMVNYFHIFSIPEKYSVDPQTIKNMARDLQKEFHPDKCGDESELKQKMEKYSSYINQAKATLLNDLQRAIYLMELQGVEVTEEIDVAGGAFMAEMFEVQEEIMEADLGQAESIKKRLETVLAEVEKQLEMFFTSQDMKKCKQFVTKYKYLSRAIANVKQRISSLQQDSLTK